MIRFGVIGTNWITEALIAAASDSGEFALTAVYSRTEERAREFAAKHGIRHIFTDLTEMAASAELDAVYIASPNCYHAEQAIIFMDHGKHVLCEKPIASNTYELRIMIEAARRNGVLLMEALKSTLLPNFRAIQENLHKIGPIRRYFASYCQYSSRYDAYKEGTVLNAFNPKFSNGALMDLGVYCIYPLVVLLGEPHRIQANAVMLDSGVDGQGSVLLQYEQFDAAVLYSKIANSYLPAEIQGENGTIRIDRINIPTKVELQYRDGTIEDLTRTQDKDSMFYEVQEFIDLIGRGQKESSTNSWANSLKAMAIMDETRRQIRLVYPADDRN
ncbi:oxidoreductase [Cohnella kolymensis]|uniref:Oxidoreductase n=1 Tax=Cohnella kolymensis TaxID=1590652 RepID=A0ABR5A7U7_9BACL|nr:Gfo/Idh/MocA family oxidoreductase [Cohnella kolymensis]KIL36893.1 oxidoreductase [Cohnella kolymensis]